jgi:hypothetical protein
MQALKALKRLHAHRQGSSHRRRLSACTHALKHLHQALKRLHAGA